MESPFCHRAVETTHHITGTPQVRCRLAGENVKIYLNPDNPACLRCRNSPAYKGIEPEFIKSQIYSYAYNNVRGTANEAEQSVRDFIKFMRIDMDNKERKDFVAGIITRLTAHGLPQQAAEQVAERLGVKREEFRKLAKSNESTGVKRKIQWTERNGIRERKLMPCSHRGAVQSKRDVPCCGGRVRREYVFWCNYLQAEIPSQSCANCRIPKET